MVSLVLSLPAAIEHTIPPAPLDLLTPFRINVYKNLPAKSFVCHSYRNPLANSFICHSYENQGGVPFLPTLPSMQYTRWLRFLQRTQPCS